MNNDNLLVKDEQSGALLSKALFSNKEFAPLLIEDILIHEYENGKFIIIDNHILDEKANPKVYKDLTTTQKERISKIMAFTKFCEKKSGKIFDISINFTFPENSKNTGQVLTLSLPGKEDIKGDLIKSKEKDFNVFMQKGSNQHIHIDKILFLKHNNKAFIFEFLSNTDEQSPQEYFDKNIDKVEAIYKIGKIIKSQLFLVAPDTQLQPQKVLCMRVDTLENEDKNNTIIKTQDIRMSQEKLALGFEQKFLGNQAEKAAQIAQEKKNKLKPPKLVPGQSSFKF